MLPKLLPNRFRAAPEGGIDLRRSILLHGHGDVAVKIQGQCDGRVAESLLCDAGMNSGQQQLGSVRVTQVMKPKRRQILKLADEFEEHVAEPKRRRLAIRARTNESVAALSDAVNARLR